ncbi:hypothetical protein [Qipengyuania sp.]|uniref:hypothetical protein n=1 Tax=Qipengyuania sp. TaxID=2004515 RepID=UPI0035C81578
MARKGIGFFDSKGHFFKTAEDATVSDIASLLGKVGEGESLAPGIAHILLRRREELERLFAEHDAMMAEHEAVVAAARNVAKLPAKRPAA